MDLEELQRHWNEFGRRDPYWAIISRPDRRGNKWELGEFMQTGVDEIAAILEWLGELGLDVPKGRALDFGCGVGRVTQALARHFERCDGVDIAPSMIEQANELNQFGDAVRYHVNDRGDLSLFPDGTFDFVYTAIVLQHIAPEYSAVYVREFTRVLAPGGVVMFQIPSHPLAEGEAGARLPAIADDAFRAEIVPADGALELEAGRISEIKVAVRNASASPWPEDRLVVLGNHWRDDAGAMLQCDDGRAALGKTVEPGETVDLTLEIYAPADPGNYFVELDLVNESVAWFADRGSPTATIPATVVAPPKGVEVRKPDVLPVMEMHGVPRPEVEAILRGGGLEVVRVEETDKAPGWADFWYIARKPVRTQGARGALQRLLGRR